METLLMCLEVFFARCADVSIGSIRTIFLVKQKNFIAFILAFIEIIIWFLVAREILIGDDLNFLLVISYALGYAFGTYVGGLINKYLVKGTLTAFIITNNQNMFKYLKDNSYGVTRIPIEGDKNLLLVEFNKKGIKKFKKVVSGEDRNAFIIINESLNVQNGYIV